MKKVITGTLITAMMSNNVVYASEIINNQSIEVNENVDITQSTEDVAEGEVNDTLEDVTQPEENVQDSNENEELLQDNESENVVQATSESINVSSVTTANTTVNRTEENVTDFNELKNAVSKSNVIINIKNDITFDEAINITGQNITINGNGRKFDLKQTDDTNRFVIKGNADNIEINNLTFDNYYTTGIYISAKNINLKDITLTGKSIEPSKAGNAKAGIDISDANTTVTLENITSENHLQSGIRVKKGSHITIKGTHIHENDAVDLQSVLDNGVNTNVIDFDNDQYIEYSKNDKQVNYRSKTLNASSFESLKKAVTQSDSVINLKENIKLTETLNITGKNITINGNGKQLDLNNTENKIVIKSTANGTELNNIDIINYNQIGLAVDSAKDVTLDELKLIGTAKKSTVGIDLSGATVKIKNITSENHRESGIRLRNESTVTFEGRNIHKNDTQAIKNVVLNNKNESTMTGVTEQYIQTSETTESDKKNIFYSFREIRNVTKFNELQDAVQIDNAIININDNITLTEELKITGKNIIFNGNNKELDLSSDKKITINKAAAGTKISNIDVKNYVSQGIFLYKTNNITLENINLTGDGSKSLVGIDVDGSTDVIIKNVTSINHKNIGIRLRDKASVELDNINLTGVSGQNSTGIEVSDSNVKMKAIKSANHRLAMSLKKQSNVEFLGGNTHTDDKEIIKITVATGETASTIKDDTKQYLQTSNGSQEIYYGFFETKVIDNVDDLKTAVAQSNRIINLDKDITLTEDLEISGQNVIINGNNKTITLAEGKKITIKSTATGSKISDLKLKGYTAQGLLVYNAKNITLENVKVTNYKTNGISIISATDVTLKKVEVTGKDVMLSKDERSKVGIDINKSTVKLDEISSSNNLYRGIQVRGESTVEILSKNVHTNDTIHMQTIKVPGENNSIIKDDQNLYVSGADKVNNGNITVDYFSRVDVEINTAKDFINNITNSGNVLHINNEIKFEQSDLDKLPVDITELEVASNVTIDGKGNVIDLNKLLGITLKGNDIVLKNLTVRNSKDIGINIYNSRDALLDNVTVENSTRYGIFVNGSTVKLKNCSTKANDGGGIQITRSRTLRADSHIDSVVEVIDSITQEESNINVGVTNLEMLDGHFQDNKFIAPDGIYNKYENDMDEKVLSEYYLDLFKIEGDARNKKYKEQTIDYMIIQQVIDVTKNTEVKNPDGTYVTLVGDGVTDNTENLKKFIEYAASHGRELYFPAGVYKISEDIDLSTINLPALSNFTLSGDKDGLAILDGSSNKEKMLKIQDAEYKSPMNYVNINNLTFNNIGLEFNGSYKKGITLNNNMFMNGQYTRQKNAAGEITKVTMEPYITAKNSKFVIEQNAFLRGENYPGRGIATYRTKNTTIKDNFFGNLEGISDAAQMLPAEVIKKLNLIQVNSQLDLSDDIKVSGSQGNFLTAINNERYDENVNIVNNYFNMDPTRNITGDFGSDVLVSGINVAVDGQRRDHIIYSKGYNNLNIYGNYFEGMENGAAGGVKIRNGKNAYVGSNHFKNVPVLTYIYGDLTKDECVLYNTTIYNNLFHQTTNFGGQGTGILYYQSYRDGDTLSFRVTNSDGTTGTESWTNAFGDVQNFVVYKNELLSDDRDQITISNRAQEAYKNNQFIASENRYVDNNNTLVGYNKGNFTLVESSEIEALSKVNDSYNTYKDVKIPLTPATVDHSYINEEINKAKEFYNEILNNDLIGILGGQHPEEVVKELVDLITETEDLINKGQLNQWDTNTRLTLIQETLEKVKATVNSKGEAPEVTALDKVTIKYGEEFDVMSGVIITDDRDIIEQLKVNVDLGNFDNTVVGTYTIKYTIEDSDGNITVAERIIIVEENENNSTNNNPNNDNNISNSDKDTSKDEINNSKNPSTSDKSNILTLSLIGMASIVGLLFVNRKKKKNK